MRAGTKMCRELALGRRKALEIWRMHSGYLVLRPTAAARNADNRGRSVQRITRRNEGRSWVAPERSAGGIAFADPVSFDRIIIGLMVQSLIGLRRILIPV
jgi:hypothetical protein